MRIISKALVLRDQSGAESTVVIECPACKNWHPFQVAGNGPRWEWNGSLESPTFSPSLLVHAREGQPRCHSFVRKGRIEFCTDSDHALAGQTVDLPEINP